MFRDTMSCRTDPYHYYPVAMAKRSEVGTRYRYLCLKNPKTFGPSGLVIAEIYKPEQGMPYTTKLIPVSIEREP